MKELILFLKMFQTNYMNYIDFSRIILFFDYR